MGDARIVTEWQKECAVCEGEGTVERSDIPLHHLYSETLEYGVSECGQCDGQGWRWTDEEVTLAQCPIGLFYHGETLCVKTEYGNNEGRIDAYIVSSGEFYWGAQPQSIENQRKNIVRPVTVLPAPAGANAACSGTASVGLRPEPASSLGLPATTTFAGEA